MPTGWSCMGASISKISESKRARKIPCPFLLKKRIEVQKKDDFEICAMHSNIYKNYEARKGAGNSMMIQAQNIEISTAAYVRNYISFKNKRDWRSGYE